MTQPPYPFRAFLNKQIQIFPTILIFHVARFNEDFVSWSVVLKILIVGDIFRQSIKNLGLQYLH